MKGKNQREGKEEIEKKREAHLGNDASSSDRYSSSNHDVREDNHLSSEPAVVADGDGTA